MFTNIKTIHEGTRYRIKDREKSEVFHYICQYVGATRKEIVNISKIRPSTVSRIAGELLDQKLIYEGDNKNSGEKGRPEISLYPNFNKFVSIALYVVSQKIYGVLLNINGDILEEKSIEIPLSIENDRMIELIKNLILSVAAKTPPISTMLGVGISLMGSMNMQTGELVYSSRWNRLKKLSIHRLEEITGLKCRLDNALNAELEYLLIKNPEYRKGGTVLYHWGYGIGASYAHNGSILRSQLGGFCEVGHISVDSGSKTVCKCGNKGCLETKAALWSMIPELKKKYPDVPDDEVDFYEYYISNNLARESVILNGTDYIIDSLHIIHSFFFPDRILLTGPFVNDERTFERIQSAFYNKLPDYAKDFVKLEVLSSRFSGEVFGSTYSFFQNALRKELVCY